MSTRSIVIPALSIRQPWAWLIVNGHKDIENRDWKTPFRGRFLVHASKTITKRGYAEFVERFPMIPPIDAIELGGFVGEACITDCVLDHPSTWKEPGTWGFVLSRRSPMEFAPYKGRLGFFNVPAEAIHKTSLIG